jgi:RNA polymerase sigma-70 factor (ECF subfamily)
MPYSWQINSYNYVDQFGHVEYFCKKVRGEVTTSLSLSTVLTTNAMNKLNSNGTTSQELLYKQAVETFGREIARFVTGYEQDHAKRQDLLQEVHLALWRSMAGFKEQCSLRTWVYRVAHNVGVTHVQRSVRLLERNSADLEEVELHVDESSDIVLTDRRLDLERVMSLIHSLETLDREIMLLYLEGLDAASISEITGLSARNVATKVHRIKSQLATRFGNRSKSS